MLVAAVLLAGFALLLTRPWEASPEDAPRQRAAGGLPAAGAGGEVRLAGLPGEPGVAEPDEAERNSLESVPDAPGRVAVRGTVCDLQGKPVPGIPVRYSLRVERKAGEESIPDDYHLSEAFTDEEGRYVIGDLPPGKLWLSLLSERGFGPSPEIDHDLRTDWTHDFVVGGSLRLSGRVEAPGTGAVDVWLDFREERAGGGWGNVWAVRRVTLSSDDRTFRFTGMRPGVYGLLASGAGLAHEEVRLELFQDTADCVVTLQQAFSASGRVILPAGLDAAESTLWVWRLPDGDWQRRPCTSDGSFTLEGVTPGRYRLLWRHRRTHEDGAYADNTERTIDVEIVGDRTPIEIHVQPDEEVGLDVRLPAGVERADGVVRIAGSPADPELRISFRASPQADGSFVTLPGGFSEAFPPIRETTREGLLRLHGLPRGTYGLEIESVGYEVVRRKVTIDGSTTIQVDLVRRSGRIVRADLGRVLYYRIEARTTDTVEAPWKQILWMDARIQISHTPTAGVFETILPVGTYEFRVLSREGAETRFGPLRVEEAEEPLVLRPTLRKGAALYGRIVAGRSAQDVDLLLYVFRQAPGGGWEAQEMKQGDAYEGEYRIEGLEPGRYRLSGSPSGLPILAEVELEGVDVEQHLRLGAAAAIQDLPPRAPKQEEPADPDRDP